MFILKDTQGLDRAFFTQARCADEITRATLQKGGFVYLEHSASPNFGTPIARLADGTGTNALKKKLVYPVMITRPEPGTPRTDFKQIPESGLITIIKFSLEGYVDKWSYFEDGDTYANIAQGDALKIALIAKEDINANENYGADATLYDRPMLVKDGNGSGTYATTIAICDANPVNGEMKIRFLYN